MKSEQTTLTPEHEAAIPADLPHPSGVAIVLVLLTFIALLGVMFYIGYVPHERQTAQARDDAAEHASSIPSIPVLHPREQVGNKEILLPCDVQPFQQTAVHSRATGYLKKQYVDINDQVKEGQLLAEIDAPEVDAQLVQSKASLEQARANVDKMRTALDLARRTYDRYVHLPAGVASDTDLDTRKSAVADAEAALKQATAAVAVAEADIQRLTVMQGFEKVTAPFAGKITSRNYDIGALLSAASSSDKPLFDLAQTDPLLVNINVPQIYANQVAPGAAATLEVRNFPGRKFDGRVDRPSGAVNRNTRTMLYQLLFPNPDGTLYAGMYGQVRLQLASPKPTLTIPISAMIYNANGTQVALVQDGKIHFQAVQVGRDLGTSVEILSGLDVSADVVANPSTLISEGLAVQAIPPKAAQSAAPSIQPVAGK